ncbi:hypothetical protein [Burkholderia sp. SRS-W-2-2016]|uniref:hypothetical protein n=1 Tax=Burkholderia sp. SRS-W-2-2016 TaxID=1926878 RepID=UPI000AE353FB
MESISITLPDNIDALKALLIEREAQVDELREQLSSRAIEIEHLKLTIAKLRRIGALYKIEEQIRGKPPDERRRVRQTSVGACARRTPCRCSTR